MQTIIGKYTKYNRDGTLDIIEYPSIEVEISSKVRFCDNSWLENCYINSPEQIAMDPCGAYKESYRWSGRVVKIDSQQIAVDEEWSLGKRVLEMPIAVICDNGEIIYCNPLNIRVI